MMGKSRLEAFSDGVLAIVITIMVLEFRAPHGGDFSALKPLIPVFLSYVLSFIYVGIYWSNHHHLLQAARRVSGAALWANLHLLFWLSLFPFATGWMGTDHYSALPIAVYGCVLLLAAVAYAIFVPVLIAGEGKDSLIAQAIGKDHKGNISIALYLVAIALAFFIPWASLLLYALVALMWLIPDRRIESRIT
ncbi:MAG: TMEM175 family protein [Lysobacter sp.]